MRGLLILESWVETLRERYAVQTVVSLVLLASLAVVGSLYARQIHYERACRDRLGHVYQALSKYVDDHGALPELAFFPDNPNSDEDSMLTVLAPYGCTEDDLLCPGTAAILRDTGNTLIWNIRLGGEDPRKQITPQWMVTEINAMSAEVPPPHGPSYNVLYSDGTVRRQKIPPAIP